MIRRILLHTNSSVSSKKAQEYALYLAKELNASLTALYVITIRAPKQLAPSNVPTEKGREAEDCLRRVKEKADSTGLEINTKIMVSRSTSDAIAEEVAGGAYDIVVMSPNTTGGLSKILSRSVSEEVIRRVAKPVLIVK
jgi:nucleotide-binding universal stress UspA family protein